MKSILPSVMTVPWMARAVRPACRVALDLDDVGVLGGQVPVGDLLDLGVLVHVDLAVDQDFGGEVVVVDGDGAGSGGLGVDDGDFDLGAVVGLIDGGDLDGARDDAGDSAEPVAMEVLELVQLTAPWNPTACS